MFFLRSNFIYSMINYTFQYKKISSANAEKIIIMLDFIKPRINLRGTDNKILPKEKVLN